MGGVGGQGILPGGTAGGDLVDDGSDGAAAFGDLEGGRPGVVAVGAGGVGVQLKVVGRAWPQGQGVFGAQPYGAAGAVGDGANADFALARYNPNGSLDTSFSGDGKQTTDFGDPHYGTDFGAYDVALQPDGNIVAVGRSGNGDFALARYDATDGSLDTSFSGDGKETTDLGGWEHGRAVAIQNGKIVVAGTSLHGADGNFALARYNPDGSLDTSFSGDGIQTSDFGVRHDAHAVAIQADGKIVVAGVSDSDDGNFALARYNDDGTLDPSFSGDGWQTTDFGGRDYGHSMALGADGRIVVAGESAVDFALARYNPDGTLDTSFSGDGKTTTDFGGLDRAFDLALQPDGKIVAAGTHNGTFALARYEGESTSGTAPTNSAPPTISGTATEGAALAVNPPGGTWTGSAPIERTYQWRRCDSAGANCVDIGAATAATYTLTAADVGRMIRVRETATNDYGTGSADSAATAVVKAKPGRIAGAVLSKNTKKAIPSASVSCGAGYSATTGTDGSYSIPNAAPGTYSCTASASVYRPSTQTVKVTSGNTTTANFNLARS